MTGVVAGIESKLPRQHLISHNIANGASLIEDPHEAVSIFNFHYAKPPDAVDLNYGLNKAIGDNETGFDGIEDTRYRTEAWAFMVAGGALYNNLDYSFTPAREDGSYVVQPGQPGGGGPSLRDQLQWLKEVFDEIDFIRMRPANELITDTAHAYSLVRVLAEEGSRYLLYMEKDPEIPSGTSTLSLTMPAGTYNGAWIDPLTGVRIPFSLEAREGGAQVLEVPEFNRDIALIIP